MTLFGPRAEIVPQPPRSLLGASVGHTHEDARDEFRAFRRPRSLREVGTSRAPRALGWKARAAKTLLAYDITEIMKVTIGTAKNGDPDMIKLCLALGIPRGEDPVSVDIPALETPDDSRVAIGRVVEETLAGEITPGEGKRLVELIEKRRTSFEILDLERQFDYARGREMFFELLIRNPVGKSRAEDLKAIYRFNADVQKQNLPQRIHDQILFNFYDHVLEQGKVANTPEHLVHEIEEFLDFMETRVD